MDAQQALDKMHARQEKINEMAALMREQGWTVEDARSDEITTIETNLSMLEDGIERAQSMEEEESRKFAKEIAEEVPPETNHSE